MGLAERHGVSIVHRGGFTLDWAPSSALAQKNLESYVTEWFLGQTPSDSDPEREKKLRRLYSDLSLNKVAVISQTAGILTCLPISWAELRYITDPELRLNLKPGDRGLRIFTVHCIVLTTDERYILARRSPRVYQYPNSWHAAAAGITDFRHAATHPQALPSIHAELEEEVGLTGENISSLEIMGLVSYPLPETPWIEASFMAEANLSSVEVLERARTAKDSWEGKHYAFDAAEVKHLLQNESFHPAGAGGLLIAFNLD